MHKSDGASEMSALLRTGRGRKRGLSKRINGFFPSGAALYTWIVTNVRAVLIMSCFFLFHFGEQSSGTLFLQYAQKRLG